MLKLYQALITFYTFLFSPLIVLLLTCSYVCRRIVEIVLRIQLKERFAGLLDGTDCVWAVEQPTAHSVNNILMILEKDARHSNVNFLESFRDLTKNRIVCSQPFGKLLYKRRRKFGYYFWERSEQIDLKRILWNVCNQPLPDDHTASWEILIGKCCPRSSHHYLRRMEERLTSKIRIPILFRVHHCLGDGMALLKFFRDVIIDREPVPETMLQLEHTSFRIKCDRAKKLHATVSLISPANHCSNRNNSLIDNNNQLQRDVVSATMPFIHLTVFSHFVNLLRGRFNEGLKFLKNVSLEDLWQEAKIFLAIERDRMNIFFSEIVWKKVQNYLKIAKIIIDTPGCLIQQAFRSMDKSALHGAELSGEKLVSYWLEDDFRNTSGQKLFTKIQNIRSITGARFGDVVLAALSASLHKYFLRMNEPVPTKISVVLPMKIEEWSENLSLQNNFSVGVLPLCVSQINDKQLADPRENSQILERLDDIKKASDALRKSPDYRVNFLVMKYLSAVLPDKFLRPIFRSYSTMVFSNLVGPQEVKLMGHSLKNIVFWIPNRSYTGIGCSLLTYRGYLQLSLIADKALVQNEKALTRILENTVNEIDNLYDKLTISFFSKKLHRSISTPTKKAIGVL